MPLHPNAKQQILTLMTEDLKYLIVKNGKYLDRVTGFMAFFRANEVLPKRGDLARDLEKWIGDFPFVEFCSETLADELSLHGQYVLGEDHRQKIIELGGYENSGEVAQRLVNSFESLPWKYTLTLELGLNLLPPLAEDATSVGLGVRTALITSSLLLADEYPLTSEDQAIQQRMKGSGLLAAMLGDQPLTWKPDVPYFQTQVDGFIGLYSGGTPLDNATSKLKAFLGLGLAMGLFAYESKYDPSPPRVEWVVHRREGTGWAVRNKIFLADDEARALHSLRLWDKFRDTYPEPQRVLWLQSVLKRVCEAISSPHSATLQLAAQWFWDSHKGTDEILRYVRRMTTLEILLGEGADTSEASLGEILGNRLAYLIGTTHKERTDTLAEFKKIYNIRSRILHRGKHRLVGEERLLMSRLQTLCERALKEEAKIVAAPEKA